MLRPTVANGLTSFDDWAARTGFWRDIQRLEEQGMIEAVDKAGHRLQRVIRLTEEGRRLALGGVLPPSLWDRGWDGKWRLAMFDIPESRRAERRKLRQVLQGARFGNMQRSVWLSPDPMNRMAEALRGELADCGVLTIFEGHSCAGESQDDLVASAWDFKAVNDAYAAWQAHADGFSGLGAKPKTGDVLRWGERERLLWRDCMATDPLLPRELWLPDYAGEKAWKRRLQMLSKAARALPD